MDLVLCLIVCLTISLPSSNSHIASQHIFQAITKSGRPTTSTEAVDIKAIFKGDNFPLGSGSKDQEPN